MSLSGAAGTGGDDPGAADERCGLPRSSTPPSPRSGRRSGRAAEWDSTSTRTSASSPAGSGRSPRPDCPPSLTAASRAGSTATCSRPWVSSGSWPGFFPAVSEGRATREAAAVELCLLRESLAGVSTEAETALALQGLGTYPVLQSGTAAQVRPLAARGGRRRRGRRVRADRARGGLGRRRAAALRPSRTAAAGG